MHMPVLIFKMNVVKTCPPTELLLQGSHDLLTQVFLAVENVSDELQGMKRSVTFLSNKMEKKPSYWAGIAKKIDKMFAYFYVTTVFVFLLVIFTVWLS